MVLGELGLRDRSRDRRLYGQRLERRARESRDEEELKPVRRSWLLGSDAFRDRVLDWMERKRAGRGAKVRREQSDHDHGERQAERMIKQMIDLLGVSEADLLSGRKGDWRKRAIAHRVRAETSVTLGWLAKTAADGKRRPS